MFPAAVVKASLRRTGRLMKPTGVTPSMKGRAVKAVTSATELARRLNDASLRLRRTSANTVSGALLSITSTGMSISPVGLTSPEHWSISATFIALSFLLLIEKVLSETSVSIAIVGGGLVWVAWASWSVTSATTIRTHVTNSRELADSQLRNFIMASSEWGRRTECKLVRILLISPDLCQYALV